MKRLSIVFTCDSEPIGLYEIERRLRTAGFKRPQAGSIMDAEQSDELAEAYEQGKQAVFDAMNHFDELAIVERANPSERTADNPWTGDIRPHAATTTPNSGSAANHTNRRPRSPYAGHARSSASAAGSPTSTTGSTATSCRASGAAADTGSNDDPRKEIL